MSYQNGIFADPATFGELRFVGHQRDRYKFDRVRQQRTDILEGRVYKLVSSVQRSEIEVEVPEHVGEIEFDFMEPVEVKHPLITGMAQAQNNFAQIRWMTRVEDIVKANAGSGMTSVASSSSKKESITEGTDKK
ncbi:DUF961 family protein [Natribacillus halophilus]|uniref:DUF961 domain-containing protein n=1 Tax=Natribacillus halophilus TaxID=549003 RepID=A0A1G8PYV3_9BACI|nr:DUF961 family protein [Natribacillus halophilus]SDI97405.1 protein of unknown function [Natribacillus halophilus]